jgi:arylsulfatase A
MFLTFLLICPTFAAEFEVTKPPAHLGLDDFYQKHVSASGYPVLGSAKVSDYALKEAAYLINMMIAKRPDVLAAMVKSKSRMVVMAHNEFTSDVPEHSRLKPNEWWDARARGLGGSQTDPVCSSAEENLLGYAGDPYLKENILIHEFAHNIHLRGLVNVDQTFDGRLKAAYDRAMKEGLWPGKYAAMNKNEYWAEGVQSWFNNNRENDHDHNHVNTRKELRDYDPRLAALCEEVFGETELVYTRPETRLTGHLAGYDPAQAPEFAWPKRLEDVRAAIKAEARARAAKLRKAGPGAKQKSAKPNIIVVMADDLGWMDLRVQGNKLLDTPNLDRLAEQGMRFTDAYAAAPVCTPTRAAMMTGLAPARLGITNHAPGHRAGFKPKGAKLVGAEKRNFLFPEQVTIAERLKEAGYATGFVGKWHLSHPGRGKERLNEKDLRPEHQGFDMNVGGNSRGGPPSYFEPYKIDAITPRKEGEYLPERLTDESIDFIRKNRKKPFFLCLWNYSVHYPIQAPKHLIEKYQQRKGLENPAYAAMIEGMDTALGRLFRELDKLDLSQNTLLIFKSDNGSLFGNRPLRRNKGFLYEGGIRVPWIVRWPAVIEPGTVSSVPVISMDTHATILDAVGLEAAEQSDGVSLLPVLSQTGALPRDALYFHYPNYAFHGRNRLGGAIREGDYKLIRRYDDDSLELYDLKKDLGEENNLAKQSPKIATRLRNKLDAWLKSTGAKMP